MHTPFHLNRISITEVTSCWLHWR